MSRDETDGRSPEELADEARRKRHELRETEAREEEEGILLPWERPPAREEPGELPALEEEALPAPPSAPAELLEGVAEGPLVDAPSPAREPPPPAPPAAPVAGFVVGEPAPAAAAEPPPPEFPTGPVEERPGDPAQSTVHAAEPAGAAPEEPIPEPERTPAERLSAVAAAARRRRMEAAREPEAESEARRDYRALVRSVDRHVTAGYDLLGLVGYSGSGKTHFLKALSLLLKRQGFEVADWEKMRRVRVPTLTPASVFDYACTGPRGEKWVFVDAGGELFARLRSNDWELADASAGLLHSLYHCRGLFLLLHLQPGHLHRGSLGAHRWMSHDERERDAEEQKAQEELEFFDHVLLFLRALKAEAGDVTKLVIRCAEIGDIDKALRSYRDASPRLDIPVAVLFTQADTLDGSPWEVAEGEFVSPRRGTVGVAPFVARHLPDLFGTLLRHARRFRFDFVQSYEEKELPADEDGRPQTLPRWEHGGEPLSVAALAALEFVRRNLPAEGRWQRLARRYEIETRRALRLDRRLHPGRWRGVGVKP